MGKTVLAFGALVIIAMIAQPVMAGMFSIYVYDQSGNPAAGALVEVWQGGNKVDSGNADANGIFTTFLREGTDYHITASGNGGSGSWDGQPYGTITIHLR